MHVAISNPDSIGDFVLRQPMFSALRDSGHRLLLIVRPLVAPLAANVAPDAEIALCHADPYAPGFSLDNPAGSELLRQTRDFHPDLLVVAPFQYTQLEEQLTAHLPGVPVAGMTGHFYPGDIHAGLFQVSTLHFDRQVAVTEEQAELSKNEALCGLILDRPIRLETPTLGVPSDRLPHARHLLNRSGLQENGYWTFCVGDNPHTRVRNWPVEKWAAVARATVEEYRMPILFIGSPDEHETTEAVRAAMGASARQTATVTGQPVFLGTLLALIALSNGYAGKDTGPMHMAAALEKPVLAVFGGGTWPRFKPAAKRGVVLTADMPCHGCDWICHLETSHCVKDVPAADVLAGLSELMRPSEVANANGSRVSVRVLENGNFARTSSEEAAESRAKIRHANAAVAAATPMPNPPSPGEPPKPYVSVESEDHTLHMRLEDLRAGFAEEESRLRSRIATLEIELQQASEALREALAVIPELRHELAARDREVRQLRLGLPARLLRVLRLA